MNHSAEIAALKRRIGDLEAKLAPRPVSEPPEAAGFGPARDRAGNILPLPGSKSQEERIRERAANETRHAVQAWREKTEGLPAGLFRDACGIVRRISDGCQVASAEIEQVIIRHGGHRV